MVDDSNDDKLLEEEARYKFWLGRAGGLDDTLFRKINTSQPVRLNDEQRHQIRERFLDLLRIQLDTWFEFEDDESLLDDLKPNLRNYFKQEIKIAMDRRQQGSHPKRQWKPQKYAGLNKFEEILNTIEELPSGISDIDSPYPHYFYEFVYLYFAENLRQALSDSNVSLPKGFIRDLLSDMLGRIADIETMKAWNYNFWDNLEYDLYDYELGDYQDPGVPKTFLRLTDKILANEEIFDLVKHYHKAQLDVTEDLVKSMMEAFPINKIDSYEIKQDYYWALGDNRDDSLDSRFWGFVPFNHI